MELRIIVGGMTWLELEVAMMLTGCIVFGAVVYVGFIGYLAWISILDFIDRIRNKK